MSKVDSSAKTMRWKTEWSNLPHDLLSRIANGLGWIDFLSFRGVCNDWRNALSQEKSFGCDPWFLLYGEGSKCSLLSNDDKIHTTNIPELDGATCLASHEGWLLLFCSGSLFFFCPFSRAKLELPNCPFTEVYDHIAAFSSAPTSPDCMVAVINRKHVIDPVSSENELELHLLCRGDNRWAKYNFSCHEETFITLSAAVFIEGEFHFLDRGTGLITFDAAETKQWNQYIVSPPDTSVTDSSNYTILRDNFTLDMRRKLGLTTNFAISICGTLHPHTSSGEYDVIIQSKNIVFMSIRAAALPETPRCLKGVWILPRYHMPPDQSW